MNEYINENGAIKFDSTPENAEIYLSDNQIGTTPLDVNDVAPGNYSYTTRLDDENQVSGNLTVYPGKIINIIVDFDTNTVNKLYTDIECPSPSPNFTVSEGTETPTAETPGTPSQPRTPSTPSSPSTPSTPAPSAPSAPSGVQPPSTSEPGASEGTPVPATPIPATPAPTPTPTPEEEQRGGGGQQPPSLTEQQIELLQSINQNISNLQSVLNPLGEVKKEWYDVLTTITTAVPVKPSDPSSSQYQFERVHDILGYNAKVIYLHDDGPGVLYIETSNDGKNFSPETIVYEGEHKTYTNIYTMALRSPVKGCQYRLTERDIEAQNSPVFSGSRFKDRRDRKGIIVYQDDYESPTLKFNSLGGIFGATVNRSIDTAYAGDFSIKTTSGTTPGGSGQIQYAHRDIHTSKIGVQIRSKFASSVGVLDEIISIFISGTTPTTLNAELRIDASGNIYILNSDNATYTKIFSSTLTNSIIGQSVWNTLKLVIDTSTGFYVSANINGIVFDLSLNPMNFVPNSSPVVNILVTLSTITTSGINYTVYYDNYLLTEDEIT